MKNIEVKKMIVGMVVALSLGVLAGCGADSNKGATETEVVSTENNTADDESAASESASSDEDLQAKYDELKQKYDELEDYSIYLEQQLIIIKAEYAQVQSQMEAFTQSDGSSKVYLVDAYTEEGNEETQTEE